MNASHLPQAEEPSLKQEGKPPQPDYWLTIFLPTDITWECADGSIRSRRTSTGEIIMSDRKCHLFGFDPSKFFIGGAETWLSAARNIVAHQANPKIPGRRVVQLSPEEEAELERLTKQRDLANAEVYRLRKAARMAVQQRNLMQKELKRIVKLWLPLAERKYPQ